MQAWAERLKGRYLAGEASMFMLHGNTRDLCRWEGEGETPQYLALVPFLVPGSALFAPLLALRAFGS